MIKGVLLGVIGLFVGILFVALVSMAVKCMHTDDFAGAALALIAGIVVYGALYLFAERGDRP
jgi:uncharacterized membrane protein YhaH (DUF805 family)